MMAGAPVMASTTLLTTRGESVPVSHQVGGGQHTQRDGDQGGQAHLLHRADDGRTGSDRGHRRVGRQLRHVGDEEVREVGEHDRSALEDDVEDDRRQRDQARECSGPHGHRGQAVLHREDAVRLPAQDPVDDEGTHPMTRGEPERTEMPGHGEDQPDQGEGGQRPIRQSR